MPNPSPFPSPLLGPASFTRQALLIVAKKGELTKIEEKVRERLKTLGYESEIEGELVEEPDLKKAVQSKVLVFISPDANAEGLGEQLQKVEVPIVVACGRLYQKLGLTEEMCVPESNEHKVEIVASEAERNHPLAARLSGQFIFSKCIEHEPHPIALGRPRGKAIRIATPATNPDQPDKLPEKYVIFGYENGQRMHKLNAPARRVAFGLLPEGKADNFDLTPRGWSLFDAAIGWATGDRAKAFDRVYRRELRDVARRRVKQRYRSAQDYPPTAPSAPPADLIGLAFSGGGIRSGTFCLGLMQGLERAGWLRLIDYLSTISGGGFTGGWWSAWLARNRAQIPEDALHGLLNENASPPEISEEGLRQWRNQLVFTLKAGCDAMGKPAWMIETHDQKARPACNFIERLLPRPARDPLSEQLWEKLPVNLQQGIINAQESEDVKKAMQEVFGKLNKQYFNFAEKAEDFKLASLESVYSWETFAKANITLTHSTFTLAQRALDELAEAKNAAKAQQDNPPPPQSAEERRKILRLMLANRLVLEEAYSDELGCGFFPPPEQLEPDRDVIAERFRRVGDGGTLVDERRQTEDGAEISSEVASDLLAAGHDPLHHLRLFSNYLIPRRGLLSLDAWNAIAYVTRNIGLTWAILLPILLFLMLIGQIFFLVGGGGDNFCARCLGTAGHIWPRVERASYPLIILLGWELVLGASYLVAAGRADHVDTGWMRIVKAGGSETLNRIRQWGKQFRGNLKPWLRRWFDKQRWVHGLSLTALLLIVAILVITWIATPPAQPVVTDPSRLLPLWPAAFGRIGAAIMWLKGLSVVGGVIALAGKIVRWAVVRLEPWGNWGTVLIIFVLGAVPLVWRTWRVAADATDLSDTSNPAVRRNQITRAHAVLLMISIFTAAVLGLAGFGPDLVDYLLNGAGGDAVHDYVARSGGLLAVLLAAGGAIYTAVTRAPSGSGDVQTARPSLIGRLTLKFAPPLIVVVLALGAAWITHRLVHAVAWRGLGKALMLATCVGIMLSFFIVLVETAWKGPRTFWALLLGWGLLLLWGIGALLDYGVCVDRPDGLDRLGRAMCSQGHWARAAWTGGSQTMGCLLLLFACVTGFFLFWRSAGIDPQHWRASDGRKTWRLAVKWLSGCIIASLIWICCSLASKNRFGAWLTFAPPSRFSFQVFASLGLCLCLAMTLLEAFRSHRQNGRARGVLLGLYITLTTLLAIGLSLGSEENLAREPFVVALALAGALLTWVIALGWTADPNLLSLHLFYRMRLVRGYLGASNKRRGVALKQVTQSVPGDDVPLKDLQNCERGGPYHLINTALNLTGGSDLGTVQRRVAHFLLSKHFCGSSRTGYRDTREYMDGQMTLGTALAVSGAAATPSVQSIGTTAAQGMLLTLLNVRMGFWAPTPNKDYWREPQARLWPFLTLREFFSQTNDLASHCYLSDGAHFNNTSIYPLIERGCRLILAADCGADPKAQFSDVGELVRRCRIDFGAKIEIDVRPFFLNPERQAKAHFVVGKITYSKAHLEMLHDKDIKDDQLSGLLVLFKPGMLSDEDDVDVLQYGIEHREDFPQQTTADQLFDEAQFESYRRLGEASADAFLKALEQKSPGVGQMLSDGEVIEEKTIERIRRGIERLM